MKIRYCTVLHKFTIKPYIFKLVVQTWPEPNDYFLEVQKGKFIIFEYNLTK